MNSVQTIGIQSRGASDAKELRKVKPMAILLQRGSKVHACSSLKRMLYVILLKITKIKIAKYLMESSFLYISSTKTDFC